MRHQAFLFLFCVSFGVFAKGEIRPVSLTGEIKYGQNYLQVDKRGRVVQTDPYGNKQYHKQQYQVVGEKVLPVNSRGEVEYHKQSGVISGEKSDHP